MRSKRRASGLIEIVVSLAIITFITALMLHTGSQVERGVQMAMELKALDEVAAHLSAQVMAGEGEDTSGILQEPLENWTYQIKSRVLDQETDTQLIETHITLHRIESGQTYTFVQTQVHDATD